MSDTMIERMARALCDSQETTEDNWQSWVHAVRVVLREMREPTEAMRIAGVAAPNYLEDQSSRRGCGNIYAAMIDAALAEEG